MRVFMTVVGTSILNNKPIDEDVLEVLKKSANKTEKELTLEERKTIKDRKEEIISRFTGDTNEADWKVHSAELNALLTYDRLQKNDRHVLLVTDTYQSQITAEIITQFLGDQGCSNVDKYVPPHLSTSSVENFRKGMTATVKWCDEYFPPYKQAGYKVIFNLTGGFKGVQGYLNTLGMIYADEIIYTFRVGDELITIPKLPLQLDNTLAQTHAVQFAILSECGCIKKDLLDTSGMPELYLDHVQIDGTRYTSLSAWGELVWLRSRKSVLAGELYQWPRMELTDMFVKDFGRVVRHDVKWWIQNDLAKASGLLLSGDGQMAALRDPGNGLKYTNYEGKIAHIGHFRTFDGYRISCTFKDGTLVLRHVGEHDYVNNNP